MPDRLARSRPQAGTEERPIDEDRTKFTVTTTLRTWSARAFLKFTGAA